MRFFSMAWIAATTLAQFGHTFDVPMYDGTSPPMRTSKPMSHGKRGSRPLDERKARRAKRHQRRAGR
jgi:hypothetical protein